MAVAELKPFKVVNYSRMKKYGIAASNFVELIHKASVKLGFENNKDVTLVLDSDGTEVDEDYFKTLDPNITFMILEKNQIWIHPRDSRIGKDDTDELDSANSKVIELLNHLKKDSSYILMISELDLELLTQINPDNFGSFDKEFLHDVKATSLRFLNDRRDFKDMLDLFKLIKYQNQNQT